jgi:hypothetical protein
MFEYGTKSGSERQQTLAMYRRGCAALLVLTGIFCVAGGGTWRGLFLFAWGMSIGIVELHRSKAHR